MCLERVLALNPDNAAARKRLNQLQAQPNSSAPLPTPNHPTPAMVKCQSCDFDNPALARFCNQCGQPLDIKPPPNHCPNCGFDNPLAGRFCGQCGEPMDEKETATLLRPSTVNAARPHSESKQKTKHNHQGLWLVGAVLAILILLMACGSIGWLLSGFVLDSTGLNQTGKSGCGSLVGAWESTTRNMPLKVEIRNGGSGFTWQDQHGTFPAVCEGERLRISLGMPGGDGVAFYDDQAAAMQFIAPALDYHRGNAKLRSLR